MKFMIIFIVIALIVILPVSAKAELKINNTIVNQTSAEYGTLTNNQNDTILKEIFDKMVASSQTFNFTDTVHTSQHFGVRKEIVNTIGKMGANSEIDYGMGPPYVYPVGFEGLITGSKLPYCRQKNAIQKASAGIKAVENGQTRADCVTALKAAILIGHRRAYGDVWIDAQIPAGSVTIDKQLKFLASSGDSTYIPGDPAYMENPRDYLQKCVAKYLTAHPEDTDLKNAPSFSWRGENAIYIGEGRYTGLGAIKLDEGTLRDTLRTHYNNDTGENMTPLEAIKLIKFTMHSRIAISPKN